jgi:hypothetical protein
MFPYPSAFVREKSKDDFLARPADRVGPLLDPPRLHPFSSLSPPPFFLCSGSARRASRGVHGVAIMAESSAGPVPSGKVRRIVSPEYCVSRTDTSCRSRTAASRSVSWGVPSSLGGG